MRDGKALEAFVASIEKHIGLDDARIESNVREYNDAGDQLAEFDIIVSGRFGSTPIRWLIECRDRPSAGPAPTAWIEQLGARRGIYGFDRVTAVSTSGFSQGALDIADRMRVELRLVQQVEPAQFADWLAVMHIEHVDRRLQLDSFSMEPDWNERAPRDDLLQALLDRGIQSLELTSTKQAEPISPYAAFHIAASNNGLLSNAPGSHQLHFVATYGPDDRYSVTLDDGTSLALGRIEFRGKVDVEVTMQPAQAATRYEIVGGLTIAEAVQYSIGPGTLEVLKIGDSFGARFKAKAAEPNERQ